MVPFPPEARSFFHRYPDIGSKPYRTPAVPPGPRGARCGALLWLLLRPPADLDAAITQPKKVAYLEQTVRAMEQGNLKIRVRSLENEQSLARLALSQQITNQLLAGAVLLQLGLAGATRLPALLWFAGAGACGAQAMGAALSIKIFDKKNARYESKDFGDKDADEAAEKEA